VKAREETSPVPVRGVNSSALVTTSPTTQLPDGVHQSPYPQCMPQNGQSLAGRPDQSRRYRAVPSASCAAFVRSRTVLALKAASLPHTPSMTDREPGWLGRQFRGVGATEPTGASPDRVAWAQRLTYVAFAVGLAIGLTAGLLASSQGLSTGASWAVAWGIGMVVILSCVIVGRMLRPPPR
jgi:hypothetical protein